MAGPLPVTIPLFWKKFRSSGKNPTLFIGNYFQNNIESATYPLAAKLLVPRGDTPGEFMEQQAVSVDTTRRRSITIALALILVTVAAIGYSLRERTVANRLAAENHQVTAALDQTRGEIAALSSRLDTLGQPPPTQINVHPEPQRPSPAVPRRARQSATNRSVRQVQRDDPRWKQFQEKLAEQGGQIDSTRQDLASARTELQGSIARTHDEVVVLQRKGERNFSEFDISKSKQFQRGGPIGIRLRKANTKRQYADLELMVEDVTLTKKHVNLLEPVMFYASDTGQPIELVINSISKDHIRGYVSQPKYRRSELAAMSANTSSGNAAATDSASSSAAVASNPAAQTSNSQPALKVRQRLPQPQ